MGVMDLSRAKHPRRRRREGMNSPKATPFRDRMPPAARRHVFIRQKILEARRQTPVNPDRAEIEDVAGTTRWIKDLAMEMGAGMVGVAAYDPRLTFHDSEELAHKFVIVFAMTMSYDNMIDIGPRSQDEVHRVYYRLDDMAVRLANQIGAMGYSASAQTNTGEVPLPAYGYLAGLGELGKHGSLISPQLGSSFRLCAVSTDLLLIADGPGDYGIDEVCANCRVCARFCPGDAIKHDKKTVNGVERWHVDTPACEPYFFTMHGCKICLSVCPFNARVLSKDDYKPMAADIRQAKDAEGMLRLIRERTGMDYDVSSFDAEAEGVTVDKDQ